MPVVHKNVLKAARQALKRRARNRAAMSGVKGAIKKLQTAIQQKQTDQATTLLREASRALQRAATKGVIHRNTASRKLSRLSAQARKGVTA
ncbi:MAG: 30S ribosomal protein S20 [Nitrospirae bacterium 13_2_20CM_2_61_4]|jgi:small subunit ribosomal protein S20|nr:MAG: 30S ribosomal protein S20 [Nitrospirae bacterium 13_2_20CM_2_61_4]